MVQFKTLDKTYDVDVYNDDTIENIKFKLSTYLDNKNINSYYLFYKKEVSLNPYDVFNQLSNNNKTIIDYRKLYIFCSNHEISIPVKKDYYELDDILELNLDGPHVSLEPIGIEKGMFITNPLVNIFNYYDNIPKTNSNKLLLDYGAEIIYVCFAENVYPLFKKKKLELDHVINVYYPYLFEDGILNLEDIPNESYDEYIDYNSIIDFHHAKYREHPELHIEEKGITSLYFVLYTKQYFDFPIEIFFKLVQSTMKYPYIKLNPGRKQENVYRLYCPNVSLKGNKSPLFDKARLNKYKNIIKKNDFVSYVIEDKNCNNIIEVDSFGNIHYTMTDIKSLAVDEIEAIIKRNIDPLIEKLIHFFDPAEKIFNSFTRVHDINVDIIDMKYVYKFPKRNKLEVSKFIKCFSPVFNLIDETDNIVLRYKRVSQFNVLDSKQGFLIDLINLQTPRESIIQSFATSFNVSLEEADEALTEILQVHETKDALNQRRILRCKNNPGFKVEISKTETDIVVVVYGITHYEYIEYLDVFIHNLILFSQKVITDEDILEICKKKVDIKIKEIEPELVEETEESDNESLNFLDFNMNKFIGTKTSEDKYGALELSDDESVEVKREAESDDESVEVKREAESDDESVEVKREVESDEEAVNEEQGESESESVNEEQGEVESESVNEEQAEAESESVNEPQAEAESEAVNEPQVEAESESVNEPQAEAESEDEREAESEDEREAESEDEREEESEEESEDKSFNYTKSKSALSKDRYEENSLNLGSVSESNESDKFRRNVSKSPKFEELEFESNKENSKKAPSFEELEFESNKENSREVPKKKDKDDIDDPVNFFGGAQSEHVFIYDHHSKKTLQKLLKHDVAIISADIKGYHRYFGTNICSLMPRDGVKCRGIMCIADENDMAIIEQEYEGFKKTNILIYDLHGNKEKGVTFIKTNIKWGVPNIDYLKKVYITVKQGWDEVDSQERLFVYNNEYHLMGVYDGTKYIDEGVDTDITKISLTHPSPFLKRLQDKEPTLFIKEESQAFSQYSKICPSNRRRYPVILSKAEKDRIDKEAPGSYDSVIEYGTDPKKKYYYICPRYWNLKTNMPVNPEDVDPSKVIDEKTKEADLTKKYIFEFATKAHGHHALASFLDKKSHPKGHFIPCCFKMNKQNKIPKLQLKRAEEAAKHMRKLETENRNGAANENTDSEKEEKIADYIQNGLKFPLPKSRIGELTAPLESFFGVSHIDYYTNPKKRKIKLNKLCLFRMGVENSKSQSFLSAIAYIFFKNKSIKEPTIKSMKQLIIDNIGLDNIQFFHNGSLATTFAKPDYETQSIDKYNDTELFEKMGDTNGFKKIVNGYENFIKYINDDTNIDYTYLWDIICSGVLHVKNRTLNMIILNETMDDVTQNINIICPTTVHSNFLFDLKHKSFFIYKRGDYYEPIIGQTVNKNIIQDPFFTMEQLPFMTKILETINAHLGECKGTIINKFYRFEKNISLVELIDILDELPEYKIVTQVMNYDGKIIAAVVENKHRFYVPCAPSNLMNLPYKLISDDYWNNYPVTVKYLKKLYVESRKRIPCLPKFRVIDREKIIGIVTMTNQFVMLKNPEDQQYNDDGLTDINDTHYMHHDDEQYDNYDKILSNSELKEEYNIIDKLKLETYFYNAYYNTLKVSIGDISNLDIRKRLEDVIHNDEIYMDQFLEMKAILDPLVDSLFTFQKYTKDVLLDISEINLCKKEKHSYCTDDGKLIIPSKNLYTKENNSNAYLRKFIDNLLRNHHIQVSIFNEAHSTIYYTDQYNLTDNELLILESMLIPYIDALGPVVKKNKYIEFRAMEDLTPHEIFELLEPLPLEEDEDIAYSEYNTNVNDSPGTIRPESNDESPVESPKVESPVESPDLESPDLESPKVESPVESPDVESPDLESPVESPDLESPVESPDVESPDVEFPATESPNIESPVESPDVESPNVNSFKNNSPKNVSPETPKPVKSFISKKIPLVAPFVEPPKPVKSFVTKNPLVAPFVEPSKPVKSFISKKIPLVEPSKPVKSFISKKNPLVSALVEPPKSNVSPNLSFNSNKALSYKSINSSISSKSEVPEDESEDDEKPASNESDDESNESGEDESEEDDESQEDESEEDEKPASNESEDESQDEKPASNESEEDESQEEKPTSNESGDESEDEETAENLPKRHVTRMLRHDRNFKEKTTNIWKSEFREGRHKCIHKMYLTKVWAKFFKKGTTSVIRFGTDNIKDTPIPEKECNYFLLNIILKDYENTNRNYEKRDIDSIIISGYRKHFKEETKTTILKKWIKEKSDNVMDVYRATNKLRKLEMHIQTTEYFITLIDIIMFMASSKIPILLLYQSKKTKTSDGIKLFYMQESDFYYIIKLRNNRIFMLHMWSIAKNMRNNVTQIKFYKENMSRDLINKLTRISTVGDYFKSLL